MVVCTLVASSECRVVVGGEIQENTAITALRTVTPKWLRSCSESEFSMEKREVLTVSPIARPLAGKKLCKKTLKLVRRAIESKCLKRGVKEVVKSIRRGNKGLCIIAGNISPIDVITHVPVLCEEADIPYIYVPSKEGLASAGATKRPTCCVLVLTSPTKGGVSEDDLKKLKEEYSEVVKEVQELTLSFF